MNIFALLAADPNIDPTFCGLLRPANPASAEAIADKVREEWQDGAQQRAIDARQEQEERDE